MSYNDINRNPDKDKFRIWNIQENCFDDYNLVLDYEGNLFHFNRETQVKSEDYIVEHCLGRRDVNGVLVYTGDKLIWKGDTRPNFQGIVYTVRVDGGFGFRFEYDGGDEGNDNPSDGIALFHFRHHSHEYEVVGNVHTEDLYAYPEQIQLENIGEK